MVEPWSTNALAAAPRGVAGSDDSVLGQSTRGSTSRWHWPRRSTTARRSGGATREPKSFDVVGAKVGQTTSWHSMTQPSTDKADPPASVPSWRHARLMIFEFTSRAAPITRSEHTTHFKKAKSSRTSTSPSRLLAAPRTTTARSLRGIQQRPVRQRSSFHWYGMDFTRILPDRAHMCNF